MLRVPVARIEPGMVLARPVPYPHDPHRYLLQRDVEIPSSLIPRLQQMGVCEVWIRYRELEFLEDLIDEELEDRRREVYHHVRRNFEEVMAGAAFDMEIASFQASISGLFSCLKESHTGTVLLQKLDAYDNYLMAHSTNVCYLALLLGMKLERYLIEERTFKSPREAKDLQVLGMGMLLHDVGKMRIPEEVLNKPGKLTAGEMELVRQHPSLGYEMVRGRIPPTAAQIVLNHHQRWDGKGYPARLDWNTGEPLPAFQGKQIPIFCRIATVVDVYDAATTRRCYSPAKPPIQVLHEMQTICQGFFDPVVEKAFYEIIPPFPIAQMVKLSSAAEAVVVDFNPRCPTRPKVQMIRSPEGERLSDPSLHEIDLAIYPELQIVEVDGHDVRPFQTNLDSELAGRFASA